ncbi:MAG: hypothetical protein ACD_7C00064G0001 [uncultured bacterium]|nr:MAG: hypothetical protein ACD_7C00064G0001 [uncultured bacterium]
MKKNMYLWIFIAVAVILCGMFLAISKNVLNTNEGEAPLANSAKPNSELKGNKAGDNVNQEKIDLTQTDIDFEEDAEDLADAFMDDSSFDEADSFDSIEGEV